LKSGSKISPSRKFVMTGLIMAGLVPAIYVFTLLGIETWMPATSAGMTVPSISF
jgi:hypothetical protein